MANFYVAEVRNIMDPLKSGRVQVRIYGFHDDEQQIKDEDLPWALSLQPTSSPATGKAGITPALIVGSRVIVSYLHTDTAEQYPIIFGSFARGALPSGG